MPFFDALRAYASAPVGQFHALPVARGASIFNSKSLQDMGEFYGRNIFMAETSTTSGGLDSLLDPHGNIKKAMDKDFVVLTATNVAAANAIIDSVRAVLEAAGIRNVLTKSQGSRNPHNVVKATIAGLKQLRSVDETARSRGKDAAEIQRPRA